MKTKEIAAILQIGSTALKVMVGRKGVSDNFVVLGEGRAVYGGYEDGQVLEPHEFEHNLKAAVAQAENSSQTRIETLYAGVPTHFCRLSVKDVNISLKGNTYVKEDDIYRIFENGNTYQNNTQFALINRAPIYYMTDDNCKTIDVYSKKTTKLSAKASYILSEKSFLQFVGAAANAIGIPDIRFVSTALAQSLYLLPQEERETPCVIADIGNIDSSVLICQGEGLLSINSFGCGGGFITADLSLCLKIQYDIAEALKQKVVLSLLVDNADKYVVVHKNKELKFSCKDVNAIVQDRLEEICEIIARCVDVSNIKLPEYSKVYLTGGGLGYIRGIKDFMSKRIKRQVELLTPRQPLRDKPQLSQSLSLLDFALKKGN